MRLPLLIGGVVCAAILGFVLTQSDAPSDVSTDVNGAGAGSARAASRSPNEPAERSEPGERQAGDETSLDPSRYAELRADLAAHLARLEAQADEAQADEVGDADNPAEADGAGTASEAPLGPRPHADDDEAFTGELDREYIQDAIREVLPLVGECYELMLDAQTTGAAGGIGGDGELDAEGRVVLGFVIGGEEEVGGVVIDPEIDTEQSANFGSEFSTCITETLMTLELPAPESGGQVRVTYPFNFRPEPEVTEEN